MADVVPVDPAGGWLHDAVVLLGAGLKAERVDVRSAVTPWGRCTSLERFLPMYRSSPAGIVPPKASAEPR